MTQQQTAQELFLRIRNILLQKDRPTQEVQRLLHETLVLVCNEGLKDARHAYGNLSSKVEALCKVLHLKAADTLAVHRMRRHGNAAEPLAPDEIPYDCRALALLVAAVYDTAVPTGLTEHLPRTDKPRPTAPIQRMEYLRCIVREWDEHTITALADHDGNDTITINYADTPEYIDHTYLRDILREGMQLNLLDINDGVPGLIVVEPDYLLDISSIANCFEDYGHHPLLYTVNRLRPRANTKHTILGNFAGSALDDIINMPQYDIADTLRSNFREKALEYCTCNELSPEEFKQQARRQVANLQQITAEIFRHADRRKALLEPSFVCERLGLQGRVDLMTTDLQLLVEQKSGKNIYIDRKTHNRHGSMHLEKHYVQLLLYYGILRYNFHLTPDRANIRLLYSRYPLPDGLMEVQPLQKLIREAIRFRNLAVATDFQIAREGFASVMPQLTPETLNTSHCHDFFYRQYLLPPLQETLQPLQQLQPLEQAYFNRMMTFIIQEQIAAKTGAQEGIGGCSADLWNMPLSTKRETGNIYTGLILLRKQRSNAYNGYDTLTFSVPPQGDDFLPNFRRGDMVYLYTYREGQLPDVRKSILFKGILTDMTTRQVTIHLNDGQQNPDLFDLLTASQPHAAPFRYAVEHAYSDIGSGSAIQSLHAFITCETSRRQLLLGRRAPKSDHSIGLSKNYHPTYDDIILRARQARDYFLLVGPPGTGKTSMALRYLVEEELATEARPAAGGIPPKAVLLLSYTNRAVDEICHMLDEASIDYIRLGSPYSCDPQCSAHLLECAVERHPRLHELRQVIAQTRVVVATTSTLQARFYLLAAKHFSLAIVDEAGQILEPGIIGILSAPAIDRFILIGDHKQLPAVVQQTEKDSSVSDPLLLGIQLDNCRQSLFERLLRTERAAGRTDCVGILRKQGRMHPDIAAFPNHAFYHRERLEPVPLPHQEENGLSYLIDNPDEMDKKLSTSRVLFIDSSASDNQAEAGSPTLKEGSAKNLAEAKIVADILQRIHRYYGTAFKAEKTVGVIVPYRNQIAVIRKELEKSGISDLLDIAIDTVERYQGSQRDVIVYAFTVSRHYQLSFLTANRFEEDGYLIDRKLNVALTRARKQLILTGNRPLLCRDRLFRQLIESVTNA